MRRKTLQEPGRQLPRHGPLDQRQGVNRPQFGFHFLDADFFCDIRLCHQQNIGTCRLRQRLRMSLQLAFAQHGVDRAKHTIEGITFGDQAVGKQRLYDWPGVGETGCFDHHTAKTGDLALQPFPEKFFQNANQIIADTAANATVLQYQHRVACAPHEMVVQSNRAQFID